MQGVFIEGGDCRPRSKKALKEAVAADPSRVILQATSPFGDYAGPASEMPENRTVTIAGPDPYTKRNWYARIMRTGGEVKVI